MEVLSNNKFKLKNSFLAVILFIMNTWDVWDLLDLFSIRYGRKTCMRYQKKLSWFEVEFIETRINDRKSDKVSFRWKDNSKLEFYFIFQTIYFMIRMIKYCGKSISHFTSHGSHFFLLFHILSCFYLILKSFEKVLKSYGLSG